MVLKYLFDIAQVFSCDIGVLAFNYKVFCEFADYL